ncbi:DNA cytosine methyltransferase [Moorena sp. SIO3A2]|uniref:DNA cytosine methyltransferase n=1 Tax=Moorena sp. SIO3A2 TaxID=2607841 RepID=UPI0013BAC05E|nr:DNA cytosine methyltransferase [Moorena sp. SIO3A2]NER90358.1 DNA cytosine methyltransferase [Moorena sp. SIO3A2]
MTDRPFDVLSLCSGILTCHLAVKMAGLQSVFSIKTAVESDDYKKRLINDKISTGEFTGTLFPDIKSYRGTEGQHQVIVGGTPCTGTSLGNTKRKGFSSGKSSLWNHFFRIVTEEQPRLVVWENPTGSRVPCKGTDLSPLGEVVGSLASLGFTVEWISVSGRERDHAGRLLLGQPHIRRRVFVFAYMHSRFGRKEFKKIPRWERHAGRYSRLLQALLEEQASSISQPPYLQGVDDGDAKELDLRARLSGLVGGWWKLNPFTGPFFALKGSIPDRQDRVRAIGDACSVPELALVMMHAAELIKWANEC